MQHVDDMNDMIAMNTFADLKVWTTVHQFPFPNAPRAADGSPSHLLMRFHRPSGRSEFFIVAPTAWERVGLGYGVPHDDEAIAQSIEMFKAHTRDGDFDDQLVSVFGAVHCLE